MTTDHTNPTNAGKDEFKALPDQVARELAAHLEAYNKDPVAAHYWDPICIGVPGGPVACLLLTHTGRKSGKSLQNALQYYRRGKEVAVVGSRGGTVEHPHWYLNLVAHPECAVQIANERFRARARTVTGPERAPWWAFIVTEQPMQREYETRTSREIPVVVLDPIP
jgi:deazaflavin-dependent oxidoreductase (nitroreductase family)